MRSTIAYNEDIAAPPNDQDVVDYVLFESREGYCEYYASAMAVLLRAEAHPSRVVRRLLPGAVRPERGRTPLPGKEAHLWVEAFFPGYGWIPSSQQPTGIGSITAI